MTFLAAVPSAGSLPVDGGEFPEEAEESERKVPTAPPPRTLLAFTKFNMLEPTSLPFPSFPPTTIIHPLTHPPTRSSIRPTLLPPNPLTLSPPSTQPPIYPGNRSSSSTHPSVYPVIWAAARPPVPHPVIHVSTLSPFPYSSKCPSISSASIQRMFLRHRRRNTRPFLGDQERLPGGRPPTQRHEECIGGI